MGRLLRSCLAAAMLAAAPVPAGADGFSALARLDPGGSVVAGADGGLDLTLRLSQPVPWRAVTAAATGAATGTVAGAAPATLVVDLRGLDPGGAGAGGRLGGIDGLRPAPGDDGWTRLVLPLDRPLAIVSAGMETGAGDGGATIRIRLGPARPGATAVATAAAETPATPAPAADGPRPLVVALDPGHGGIDPGAEGAGLTEAALMLIFARDLKEALLRAGGVEVVLTRDADVFVPLDTRLSIARAAGADLFVSLHADAVAEGRATGASVYTLSASAADEATAALVERHERTDLLSGVDLGLHDDVIAGVLMDVARLDTGPRAESLADALAHGLEASVGGMHKRPRRSAGFSVLRAADIPSALVELGYISSAGDRDRLTSPAWRERAARGLAAAILGWADEDRARRTLLRR